MLRKILVCVFFGVAATTFFAFTAIWWIQPRVVNVHQKSVTKSIATWGVEYSCIENEREAIAAVEILKYIEQYYVPGAGYRGTAAVEENLERTRADVVQKISNALANYSGTNFGTNALAWQNWAEKRVEATKGR
jgi:hypothetical protein